MTRNIFIERILRQIYNGQPSDDSSITYSLVNQWLNDAIGLAAKRIILMVFKWMGLLM